jgi:hypothetical protein
MQQFLNKVVFIYFLFTYLFTDYVFNDAVNVANIL